MLAVYFGFSKTPFVNKGQLYASDEFKELEARISLTHQYSGVCLITGKSGAGKTYAITKLIESFPANYKVMYLSYYDLRPYLVLKSLAEHLDLTRRYESTGMKTTDQVVFGMVEMYTRRKLFPVVIIDEADYMKKETYELLDVVHGRLSEEFVPLKIIIVGRLQTRLHFRVGTDNPLSGKLLCNYQMDGLTTEKAIKEYCLKELQECLAPANFIADTCWPILCKKIDGSYKILNTILFNAMQLAYLRGEKTITAATLVDVIDDLKIDEGL